MRDMTMQQTRFNQTSRGQLFKRIYSICTTLAIQVVTVSLFFLIFHFFSDLNTLKFAQTMASLNLKPITLPSKVGSSHEAHQLIGKACKLRVEYQEKKADSLRRLQLLLDEVKWIDDKILEVDIHIGRIYHVVDSSGFEIPPPIVAHREHTVVVDGGMWPYHHHYLQI